MVELAPRVQMMNIVERRTVFAARDFPNGCGPKAIPIPNHNPILIESASTDNGVNVDTSSELEEEIGVLNLSELKSQQIEPDRNGNLDPSEGAGGKTKEEPLDSEKNVNETVVKEKALELKRFAAASQRRRVWAVRDFPVGCGSGALEVGKGPVASSESKVVDDGMEVGSSTKRKAESFEKAEDDELIGETIRETQGYGIGIVSKMASSSGEKKKPAEKPEGDAKRDESNRILVKAKEASREAKVQSPKVEGSIRVSLEVQKNGSKKIKQDARESGGEVPIKPSMKDSSRESIVDKNREKVVKGHDEKQGGKNHHDKESGDLKVSAGIKMADKIGRSVEGKPVGIPKDGKSMKKRTLPDDEGNEFLDVYGDRLIVQALKSAENCPWRKDRKLGGVASRSFTPNTKTEKVTRFAGASPSSLHKNIVNVEDDEDCPLQDGGNEKTLVMRNGCRELDVTMTPSIPTRLISMDNSCNEEVASRKRVKKVLQLFRLITSKLTRREEKSKDTEAKSKDSGIRRVDLAAYGILKKDNEWVNHGEQIIGHVPGVEVGDEFQFRVELSIIGLHRPFQAGIDYTKRNGVLLATSIVASGGYPDDVDNSDVLIYSGSGGSSSGCGDKQGGDQKLERGNLALKNSIDAQTPVRVIYGSKELCKSDSRDAKSKMISTFTYDGLYVVESCRPQRGTNNFIVYKFRLRRLPGQPEIALKEIKKAKKSNVRVGLCVKDISNGDESIPICAVNTIDKELPAPFKYIKNVIYPSSYAKKAPDGCDCTDGCSDSEKCACAMKNGGEIPYNFNGAIVQARVLVYECGPSCKCPPSCHNRVSQHAIKIPLEIFKSSTRGWGVRSLYSIPSGTFVCEYAGEMLRDAEAEQRINDEYLFDIGHNYDDHTLWDGLPSFAPHTQSDAAYETVEDVGFTIDAAKYGNVGRFINHSCSPNLYAQNVLYDHDEKKMPHVMFFAIDNIPPLQELTYHYNYTLNQVRDSEGNIKKKECFCGSPECIGRLY